MVAGLSHSESLRFAVPDGEIRALLVGTHTAEPSALAQAEELLSELGQLTATLGLRVLDRVLVKMRTPQSRYLIGSGKAAEIVALAAQCGADAIIFDETLTPSQQRNWEKLAGRTVIDRQEVILDIFARHARTKEAVLQVALARAEYDLPRLKRRWVHLSRQRGMKGGMMGRGEGEQQIEIDSRQVQTRISQLRAELAEVSKVRHVQRQRREKRAVPVAAIVGYTNAGKSCLFNSLTHAGVVVEDILFATLDATVRRLCLPNNQELLLVDTVGFVRKLPHLLVEAFRSTLEEITTADFLIEVLDVSSSAAEEHHATTCGVLQEIGGARLPTITVFNKTDLVPDPALLQRLRRRHHDAVFLSAKSGAGLEGLLTRMVEQLEYTRRRVRLFIPHSRYDVLAMLHRTSHILSRKFTEEGIEIAAAVPVSLLGPLGPFNKNSVENG